MLHDLNLASLFSEYVILMKEGKIFAMGETAEVLTPQNIEKFIIWKLLYPIIL